MPAVITGVGLGLERSSASVLGAAGEWGRSSVGEAQNDVYVNAANGNLVVQAADQFLIGLGLNEDVVRTYNSQGARSQTNGALWSDANNRQVLTSSLTGTLNASGSTIQRVGADGSVFTYTYNNGLGAYQANEGGGAYDTLSYSAGSGLWTWTDGATQDTEVYDSAHNGRIVSASDQTGANTLSYAYDATTGLLTSVTTAGADPSSGVHESTSFFYVTVTGASELSYVQTAINNGSGTLATSTYVHYGYESQGRLTSQTTDITPGDGAVSDGNAYTTTYGYSGTTNRLTSITQSDGSAITFAYDGSNRVSSYTQSLTGSVSTSVNFTYSSGYTTATDSAGDASVLQFDSFGQLTSIVSPLSQTSSFSYDSMGDLSTITAPNGNVDAYTYDARGNQTYAVDSLGNTTSHTYSATNRLLTSSVYLTPASAGTPGSSPLTSTYVYDTSNNLAYSISPNNEITQYIYGGAPGEATEIIQYAPVASMPALTLSALNTWSSGSFDKSGAVITTKTFNVRGQLINDSAFTLTTAAGGIAFPAVQTVFSYDQAGATELLFHFGYDATPTGHAYEYATTTYDGLERAVSSTDTNGTTTNYVYSNNSTGSGVTATNAANSTSLATASNLAGALLTSTVTALNAPTAVSTYAYDSLGRVRTVTGPTGVSSYFIYDADGRKVADIAADGSIVGYAYNVDNQVIQTLAYANKLSSSQLAFLTTSGYSTPVALSSVAPTASSADQTQYSIYDLAGRLAETIDGVGAAVVYTYDGAWRLISSTAYATPISASTYAGFKSAPPTSVVTPSTSSSTDQVTTYTYDADGRLTQSVLASGVLNLATTTTYNAVGEVVAVSDPDGTISRNAYDQAGRLIYTIDGAGDVVYRTYNPDNRLLSSTRYATPLSSAVMGALGLQVTTTTIAADVTASSSSSALADDKTLSYTYDADGRLLSSAPMGATATYDALGEVVATTDALGNSTRYAYDGDGRQLFAIDATGAVTQTTYNAAGQAVARTTYATALTASQLSALTPSSMGSMTPTALVAAINADVTASAGHDETTRSVYDLDGRLAYSFDAVNRVTEYDYDAQGRVVQTIAYATAIFPTSYSYGRSAKRHHGGRAGSDDPDCVRWRWPHGLYH